MFRGLEYPFEVSELSGKQKATSINIQMQKWDRRSGLKQAADVDFTTTPLILN